MKTEEKIAQRLKVLQNEIHPDIIEEGLSESTKVGSSKVGDSVSWNSPEKRKAEQGVTRQDQN